MPWLYIREESPCREDFEINGIFIYLLLVYWCREIVVDKKLNEVLTRIHCIFMPVWCFLFLLVAGVVLWWRNLLVKTAKVQLSSQNTSVGCSRKK